ncbi:hypothetical protein [Bacteroides reticulotermitis]|uniref:Uncharacterized protein n=1 Tax=Bacteroides reticulotermitis TaxID=1133319 RepID=A0A840D3F9_9BACE|nr:hypothetical protein [Bacteroides reticulotermitis]MBB4045359.1 hypothetical protein [Bacteroides reticulotermitis]
MKQTILLIVLIVCVFYTSCNSPSNNKVCMDFQIHSMEEVFFNEQMDSFLTAFLDETQEKGCIYELYVDKKNMDEYQLSLLCGRGNNILFRKRSVNYTVIRSETIYIYSGIEDFVNKDTLSINPRSVMPEYLHAWYKIILPDTSYVVKVNSIIINPFCTATLRRIIEFEPPNISQQ